SRLEHLHRLQRSISPASSVRCSFQTIHYRCAESLVRNTLCDDTIETERIELAQIAEEICGCFAKILFLAQLATGCEPMNGFNRTGCQESDGLASLRRIFFGIVDQL